MKSKTRKMRMLARRQDERMRLKTVASVQVLVSPDSGMKKALAASVLDMSLGGVGIKLEEGCLTRGRYYLQLPHRKAKPLTSVLVWSDNQAAGLRFLADTAEEIDLICDFARGFLVQLNPVQLLNTTLQLFSASQKTQLEMLQALEAMIFDQLAEAGAFHEKPQVNGAEAASSEKLLTKLLETRNYMGDVSSIQRKAR